jgi:hypothetical protein
MVKNFLFSTESSPPMGPTQAFVQRVPATLPQGIKWPGLEAENVDLYIQSPILSHDVVVNLGLQTLALTSPTNGGRSVGIVRSRTNATKLNS